VNPGYGKGCALSCHRPHCCAASAQHECAVWYGVFHNGVLLELLEDRSDESVELLQSTDSAGQGD